jgi:protein-tyrosine phosphatase
MIVRFPDGTSVQATGAGRPDKDPRPDFGLYLDACWSTAGPDWDYVLIDWPDFGLPTDTDRARDLIRAAFKRARSGQRVEVGCLGGTGRTGTVVACMAVLSGVPAEQAVQWVRLMYRPSAVETTAQQEFVLAFRVNDHGQ